MDIQQIAEKLFNFCKEKYPNLEWKCNYPCGYRNSRVDALILGSCSLFKLKLEICKDWECIRGHLEQQGTDFRGCFLIRLGDDKDSELEFYKSDFNETTKSPDKNNGNLCKKARKMVREIFNFIEDKIQK